MKDIYRVLEELGISYGRHDHPPVYTVKEADTLYGHLPGGKTKNLFLRNKKGNRHYLVVVESHKQVDLKKMRLLLGESALSFASPERLQKYLGLAPGAVSPFGIINDKEKEVVVVIDGELWRHDILNYHPNDNTATLSVSREDFRRFLAHCGNEVRTVELSP